MKKGTHEKGDRHMKKGTDLFLTPLFFVLCRSQGQKINLSPFLLFFAMSPFLLASRHSFATHLLERDVDIGYIQALLGNNSSKTTEIYTQITSKGFNNINSPLDDMDI